MKILAQLSLPQQITSTVATGTPPLTVASTSLVTNLNADMLDGLDSSAFALASHGNHVPTLQAANNTIFLRSDNTWATVTPGNIGAMATTHVANSITGLGASGTATIVSRSDHNHDTIYQALDADLTSIAGLSGTSGFLKKTAANTWALDTNAYLTGNQSITVSGDATGSGSTTIALTLANSGVTAGTYTKLTVNAKGLVTAGAAISSSDITTALGFTPVDDAGDTMLGDLTFNTSLKGVKWVMNTDYANIVFKNTGDADTDSYLNFETGDNGNEYFKFSQNTSGTITELASIKSDGLRVKGSLAWTQASLTKVSQLTNDSGFLTAGNFVAKSGDTMTGTLNFDVSGGEKQVRSGTTGSNWGMFFNTGGGGFYDWTNGRGVFSYTPSTNTLAISTTNLTHGGNAVLTTVNTNYNTWDAWLRENGDNNSVKMYGNSRQMAFRTDGTTEYATGVGPYPFAFMYGGDAAANRMMLLNTTGDMWTPTNGWLSTALAGKLPTNAGCTRLAWNDGIARISIDGGGNNANVYNSDKCGGWKIWSTYVYCTSGAWTAVNYSGMGLGGSNRVFVSPFGGTYGITSIRNDTLSSCEVSYQGSTSGYIYVFVIGS